MKGATASQVRPARRSGRSWLLRAGLVLALAGMVQVGGTGPASAHAVGGGPTASNYRTSVRGIEPAIPGVSVRVVDGGNQLELTNRGSQEVTLLGYENEPYLRVGPSGVFENEHSPSTFSNRSTTALKQIPAEFSADAARLAAHLVPAGGGLPRPPRALVRRGPRRGPAGQGQAAGGHAQLAGPDQGRRQDLDPVREHRVGARAVAVALGRRGRRAGGPGAA